MHPPEQIMTAIVSAPDTFYIFRWDRQGRKGRRCVILARGTMNSCLVRFEDGYMMVTSRNALEVPFNPTVATETVSAALAFAKCGITIRHSELPVVVPLARLMTAWRLG